MGAEANLDSSRRWRRRYIIEAVLLGLLAVAAFSASFHFSRIEYVGALNNSCGDGIWAAIRFYRVFALVSLILAVCAMVQVFLSPHTCKHILLRIGFLFAIPVLYVGGYMVDAAGGMIGFSRGYEKWILQTVDIDAIQQWLVTEGHDYIGQGYDTRDEFPDELPGFLTEFEPQYISFLDSTPQGGPYAKFEWRSSSTHWGFIIGPPTMPMPERDASDLTPILFEYRYPIKPGVYVFEQG